MKTTFISLLLFINPFIEISDSSAVLQHKHRYAQDHLIVKLKANPSFALFNSSFFYEKTIYEISDKYKLEIKKIKKLFPSDKKNHTNLYHDFELETYFIVYFNDNIDVMEVCKKFISNDLVDFAEPDFKGEAASKMDYSKPNDEFFKRQWALSNDGSIKTTGGKPGKKGADMNVLKGWEIEKGSDGVIVAILDSGVKTDHPDIQNRLWVNHHETKNGIDDDGNGFIDDILGYNFAYDNSNVRDDAGHGTNIAGTVGAETNNLIGYAGIDQNCRLMICKNLDNENTGEYSWWAASLYYAANNGAKVINMSEGGYDYSKTLATAVKFAQGKGCLIVASMMNKNNNDPYYPASLPDVLAVGATDIDDSRCKEFTWGGGSNWGKHISVVAPGNKIYGLDYKDNYNYDIYWSGTSQSTAYVSGIASILISQKPDRTFKELIHIITSTAADQVGDPSEDKAGWDEYHGWGRVDLYAALNYENYSRDDKKPKNNEKDLDKGNSSRVNKANPADKKINKDDDDRRARKPEPKTK